MVKNSPPAAKATHHKVIFRLVGACCCLGCSPSLFISALASSTILPFTSFAITLAAGSLSFLWSAVN